MRRRVVLLMGLVLLVPALAHGAVTINVGNWTLNPNQANQTVDANTLAPIELSMAGTDATSGMDLYNWINGGVAGGPIIDGFSGNGTTTVGAATANGSGTFLYQGAGFSNMVGGHSVNPPDTGLSTSAGFFTFGSFAANSAPFAGYSFSTVGVLPGTYSWSLTGHPLSSTIAYAPGGTTALSLTIVNGTITVTPEPGSMLLCLFGAAGVAVVAIRRRRRKA